MPLVTLRSVAPVRRSAAGALVTALLAACTAGESGASAGDVAAADLLVVEARTLRREHGRCQREGIDSAAVPCVTVSIAHPEVRESATAALGDSVRAFVRQTAFAAAGGEGGPPGDDAAGVADSLVAEYDEIAAAMPDLVEVWALEREVGVRCQTARHVSLAAREYRYTGGAHGLETVRLASLDAATGRRLALDDLITDRAAVTAVAEREFRRQQAIPPGQSLAQAGYIFFEDERFALTDNVLLCGDTLHFHWDPYEIAPYALGPTDLALPMAALGKYVRRE